MVEQISNISFNSPVQAVTTTELPVAESNNESVFLRDSLNAVTDKQGVIGKSWDKIKDVANIGISSKDCEEVIRQYEKGEVSLEDALAKIKKYEAKQNNSTELISNILTGVVSIAVATSAAAAGPIGWAFAALKGAPIGAAVKTVLKGIDRATNNIDGDVLDAKTIAKDAVSGAVTGMTSAVSSNVAAGIKQGSIKLAIKNGVKSGAACGAVSGATTYGMDVALDKDKKFNTEEFLKTTAFSSFVSGTVGGVVGAGLYGIASANGSVGPSAVADVNIIRTTIKDSASSTSRKILGKAEKDVLSA